ncbi:MAG TPA: glycosyltransferase [Clostridia bacterium]|nr:glycosyltransferase [Clostridia bacterium]
MKQRYYIATPITPDNFAGTKARRDIETLAERHAMRRIEFLGGTTANRSLIKRVQLLLLGIRNWLHLFRTVAPGSLVLFQYPHYPMKSAVLARHMMRIIQRTKQVTFAALVHDLNSVRKTFGKAAVYSDQRFLRAFDVVICHNERMREYLIHQGFDRDRLVPLGVFDYLAEVCSPADEAVLTPSVNIAGNLSREKSAYLQELLSSDPGFRVHLYGTGLDFAIDGSFVQYEGFAPPETLPCLLRGMIGLVWDGDRTDTCSGEYGAYLSINNPHKVSLYLCAGIPVIIWSGAALAGYIAQNGLGLCVDSLQEIAAKIAALSPEAYAHMRKNAAEEGARIRAGYYFDRALSQVEESCFKS